jgi:hypothetical protein
VTSSARGNALRKVGGTHWGCRQLLGALPWDGLGGTFLRHIQFLMFCTF